MILANANTLGRIIGGGDGAPANAKPTISATSISLGGGILDGPYTYADVDDDLENNLPPEVQSLIITGTGEVGETLTASWTFFSPSGYSAGTHLYQWNIADEGTGVYTAISGATSSTYVVQAADADKDITVTVTPVQTATAPKNGNPTGDSVTSSAVNIVPPFDLGDIVDHYFQMGSYDNVLNRAPDRGTSGGSNYFTAPAGNEPTLVTTDPNNPYLNFDPSVAQRFLNFTTVANTTGNRHFDMVARAKWTDINVAIRTLFSAASSLDFRNVTTSKWSCRDSQTFTMTGTADTVLRSFRVRASSNGSVVTVRIQVDKNTTAGTYFLDESLTLSNNGVAIAATTAKLGAGFTGTNGFNGRIYEFGLRINTWIDDQYEDDVWNRLNSLG